MFILVGLVMAAMWMLAYNATVAAEPVTALPGNFRHRPAGTLTLSPKKLDFGQVTVNANSAALTVTATNRSKSASISSILVAAEAPFTIMHDGCSGVPLTAGQSCQVEVQFVPIGDGLVKRKKGLIFTDSAKNSPQYVALEGNGIVIVPPTQTPSPTPTTTATPTLTTTPTPSMTSTSSTSPTSSMTPTVSMTRTPTPTVSCTPRASATPDIARLVLIAGGQAANGTPLNSAEIFNPATNIFTLTTATMTDARYSHAAAAINTSGAAAVLVTGGVDAAGGTKSTETFTNSSNTFVAGSDMTDSREGHTATPFNDDSTDVLIAGGQDADGTVLSSAEVKIGTATGAMNSPRVNAAAALFAEPFASTCPAQAVVTGGSNGVTALQSAELFDPASNTFTLTDAPSVGGSQMNAARAFHSATLLHDSGALKVLVAGGDGAAGVAQASAEVFDVGTKKFTLTTTLGGTDMTVARAKHTATAFDQTMVLITGGVDSSDKALATAEVFDLSTNTFTAVGPMHSARFDHAATLLPSGKVLITGGEDGSENTLNTAEIFDPVTNTFTLTTDASLGGNNMNVARKLHTATAY